jgi:PAS domain S-box-containing protein
MKIFLDNFLAPDPGTQDSGARKMVLYVLMTGLTGAILFSIMGINRPQMILLGFIFFTSVLLATRGYLELSRWVSLIATLIIISSFIYENYGIRDTGMLGLIAVLIAGGLLAGRRGTIIFGLLILGEAIAFGILEQTGVIINRFSSENLISDYLTISISIVVVTILQYLLIDRLNQNIQLSRQELVEHEKTQKLLREAENRYRSLVEHVPAVIYIAEPGQNGKWQYISPQIKALTGYTSQEWLSKPNFWYDQIHPTDRDKTIELEANALNTGDMPQLEYRLHTRDGRYIWIYDESIQILDSEKNPLVQGFLLDITARKVAEEQLQKRLAELDAVRGVSETLIGRTDLATLIEEVGEHIRSTFRAGCGYIAILDPSTNLINFPYYYNNNKRTDGSPIPFGTGMTSNVMVMKKPLLINHNWVETSSKHGVVYEDNKPAKSSLTVPLMVGEKTIGVISVQDTESEDIFTENDTHLLMTIAANLAIAIENTRLQESLRREINIQEKLIAELESKNAELERFAYTASHDLKSPLITIRGYLGYLEQDARAGKFDRLKKDIIRISDATEKMHNLLKDLLDLSRIGHVINESREVSFTEIVADALNRVEGQLINHHVVVNVESNLPIVFGDRERLVEVVQNLLDNAAKFMGNQIEPRITVGTLWRENKLYLYVNDNGVGIEKEFHQKVFELFDKLDASSDGTGVGLALVKRIIEVHGGQIWVESEGQNKGTTFYFSLPTKNSPESR